MDQLFYQRLRLVCLAIPHGKVASYGQLAMLCGAPRNARQVGYGLRMDLAGADIPAHRVVNSKGELSGAGMFHHPHWQRNMLAEEGVPTLWNGRFWQADLKQHAWRPTAEQLQALKTAFCALGEPKDGEREG